MIVSNPPYIETAVIPTLMPEVKDHEPILALDGSGDGLYFYRKIVDKSVGYMRKGGYLFFEIGYNQGDAVSRLMCDAGFSQVKVIKDYAGLDRVVMGIYS
jgi:release factor glutamine methyltransferase